MQSRDGISIITRLWCVCWLLGRHDLWQWHCTVSNSTMSNLCRWMIPVSAWGFIISDIFFQHSWSLYSGLLLSDKRLHVSSYMTEDCTSNPALCEIVCFSIQGLALSVPRVKARRLGNVCAGCCCRYQSYDIDNVICAGCWRDVNDLWHWHPTME